MTASMPATPEDLFARLDELAIAHSTVCHEPVFTVDENREYRGLLEGGHCKNLFLKNRKNAYWLVVCLEDARIDLKELGGRIGAGRPLLRVGRAPHGSAGHPARRRHALRPHQ